MADSCNSLDPEQDSHSSADGRSERRQYAMAAAQGAAFGGALQTVGAIANDAAGYLGDRLRGRSGDLDADIRARRDDSASQYRQPGRSSLEDSGPQRLPEVAEADQTDQSKPETVQSLEGKEDDRKTARVPSGTHYDPKRDVLLRLETIQSHEFKRAIACLWVVCLIAVVALFTEFGFKFHEPSSAIFDDNTPEIINVVIAVLCLAFLLHANYCFASRIIRSNRMKKRWSHRRRKIVTLYAFELFITTLNVILWLAQNVYMLAKTCSWFDHAVTWLGGLQWTCWNTIFLLFLIQGHNMSPDLSRGAKALGKHAFIGDRPLTYHWPKLLLWGAFEGLVLASIIYNITHHGLNNIPVITGSDCHNWVYKCSISDTQLGLSIALVFLAVVYVTLYLRYTYIASSFLRKQSYSEFRMANLSLRLQMRTRLVAYVLFILCVVLLYFVRFDNCHSFVNSWLGLVPMFLVMTALSITWSFFATPNEPEEVNPVLQVWLQEFAWSQSQLASKLAVRSSSDPDNEELRKQPMFCFETAIRLFYWSNVVYDHKQVEDSHFKVEYGMSMWGCTTYELFWEKALDTKALLAWGPTHLVLAFRGTDSMSNVLADLQAWRAAHPPRRGRLLLGTQPLVHRGFLCSWQAVGLDERILARVRGVLSLPETDKHNFQIYVTGHSLGGALATLAACDIAKIIEPLAGVHLACYTLGAPRTGNHAFAKYYNETVPETWHIVNDQDVVARGGKFLMLYKRPGERVIINKLGDMLVRPNSVEISTQLVPGGASVSQHLLGSYWDSFVAVMTSQFTEKQLKGGMDGVIEIVSKSKGLQYILSEIGLPLAEMERIRRWGGTWTAPEKKLAKKGSKIAIKPEVMEIVPTPLEHGANADHAA